MCEVAALLVEQDGGGEADKSLQLHGELEVDGHYCTLDGLYLADEVCAAFGRPLGSLMRAKVQITLLVPVAAPLTI